MAKRDFTGEIEEIRSRTGPSNWDNGITKLLFLLTYARELKDEREELAYFPVAAIAAMETYFRSEIKRQIDSRDGRFLNRLKVDELPIKIDHNLLIAVHGKRISIGELVAHSVRLSSFESTVKTMSQFLGTNFLALVKDARDPEERRAHGEKAPTILRSADETFDAIKRVFARRNIICHEAHLTPPVQLEEAREICESCYSFVLASHYGITHYCNPDAPITLAESYKAATERVRSLDNEIKAVEQRIASALPKEIQKLFAQMQSTWRAFVEQEASFNSYGPINMSRGVFYGELTKENLYRTRLDWLRETAEKFEAK